MDPDSGAEQAASQILKTAFISVVLTTCHYQTTSTFPSHAFKKDPARSLEVKQSIAVIKKKKKKTIYLTFDDGPNKGTKKVMHIAEEENVPITMFIVGEHVYGSAFQRETWDSISACDLIEICNHSYTHAHNHYKDFYSNTDSVEHDFERCTDSLKFKSNISRTPGRNIWRTEKVSSTDLKTSTAAADTLYNHGYELVGWDLEWHYDAKSLKLENCADSLVKQIDSVFKRGKTKNTDHLVLLAHDQVYADIEDSSQLHDLINKLKRNDEYEFEVIGKYPGVKKIN
jgi:peptidoglycan/xylan/chitin deacetylase (PgdA/CDA1 family)